MDDILDQVRDAVEAPIVRLSKSYLLATHRIASKHIDYLDTTGYTQYH